MDGREPIIVGVGQVVQRPETERPVEPLALMAEAARRAEKDAGAGDLLHEIDSLRVVNVLGWPSKDPPHDLANALAVAPREALYTAVGGNTPQWQVNDIADAIARGEIKLALLAGAEANNSAKKARSKGIDLGWSPRGDAEGGCGRDASRGSRRRNTSTRPSSRRASTRCSRTRSGITTGARSRSTRRRWASCSRRSVRSRRRTSGRGSDRRGRRSRSHAVSKDNRYIGFPYTKTMNAIMDVDQGAALLITSSAEARRLGIPEEKWVYLWGGARSDGPLVRDGA